jgi:hypothetical protein
MVPPGRSQSSAGPDRWERDTGASRIQAQSVISGAELAGLHAGHEAAPASTAEDQDSAGGRVLAIPDPHLAAGTPGDLNA